MKMLRIIAIWCFILSSVLGLQTVQAQPAQTESSVTVVAEPDVEMADVLRRDGKIYVVVIVLLTVLAGVVVYLVSLDRKVSKLEKQLKD